METGISGADSSACMHKYVLAFGPVNCDSALK